LSNKIKVNINVILHATEDLTKFLRIFEKDYNIKEEDFTIQNLKGHFDNPITILNAEITKDDALKLIKKITAKMTEEEIQEILKDIEERISNSTLYLRFDKQKFIKGTLEIQEKNPIQIKIFIPIYNKHETRKIYSELLLEPSS
jgi:RNA binding exosome subunit